MLSIPDILVNGTIADADQVMADFNAIKDSVNGQAQYITRSSIPSVAITAGSFFTTGYSAVGDKGAGALYVPGAATPTYRKPIQDASGAYWYLANGPMIYTNAGHYGLVGDGVTDNHDAIQNAIDHTAAQGGGGTIVFPIGQFVIKSGLTNTTGMRFIGAGNGIGPGGTIVGGTQIIADSTFKTGDMITCTTNQACEFYNIGFNGLGGPFARTSGAAIKILGVTPNNNVSSVIQGCAFSNQWDCIMLDECARSIVRGNTFIEWGRNGINTECSFNVEANGGVIADNYFFGDTSAATTAVASINLTCGYAQIVNNLVLGCQYGVAVIPDANSVNIAAILIINNFFEEQTVKSIVASQPGGITATVTGLLIRGNEFSNVTNVTNIQAHISIVAGGVATWLTNIVISENTINSDISRAGTVLITVQSGANVIISANVINNNNVANPGGIAIGAQVAGTILVLDNAFLNFGSNVKYSVTSTTRVRDIGAQLAYADLGSWGNGSQCYVTDGQATSSSNQVLTNGGSGCLANRARGQWLAPYALTG